MLHRQTARAFSLVEGMIGMVVVSIVVGALYTGFTQGVLITQMTREDSRAAQILLEKSEALRLCGWTSLPPVSVSAPFVAYYDPQSTNAGARYTGTITVLPILPGTLATVSYRTNLKHVRIRVTWNTGNVSRQRDLNTFVARYGLQSYVY
jgi:type II secretory pathway pseudopilin PulG